MNRETFLKQVDDYLLSNGFGKDNDIYFKSVQQQEPAQQIIINGQMMVQPGKVVKIDFKVILQGEGSIDDKEYFEMIGFEITQDKSCICEFNQSFYYDEFILFTKYCNKLFNI